MRLAQLALLDRIVEADEDVVVRRLLSRIELDLDDQPADLGGHVDALRQFEEADRRDGRHPLGGLQHDGCHRNCRRLATGDRPRDRCVAIEDEREDPTENDAGADQHHD